jgi:hypothetical protein
LIYRQQYNSSTSHIDCETGESEVGQAVLRFHESRGLPPPKGLQLLLLFAIHSRASKTAFWGSYFRFCPETYDDPLWFVI